jgi:hypothetical protein
MDQTVKEYGRTMKKTLLLRDMADPENDWRFIKLRLPIKREVKIIPYLGVAEIPDHEYQNDRRRL